MGQAAGEGTENNPHGRELNTRFGVTLNRRCFYRKEWLMALSADRYAALACECLALSLIEPNPRRRAMYLELARSYQALIDQAERNVTAALAYEPPRGRPA
jgi:hypothetical protein